MDPEKLQKILNMREGTKKQIEDKVKALFDEGYLPRDQGGDLEADMIPEDKWAEMSDQQKIDNGIPQWDGSMATFVARGPLTATQMRAMLAWAVEYAKSITPNWDQQQGAEKEDAQQVVFDINPPEQAQGVANENFQAQMNPANFEDAGANLGPAVNGGVFEDFSLGAPTLPLPSTSLTVKQIKDALTELEIPIPKGNKAKLLQTYRDNYPQSPAFSPQSPNMGASSSSSGMSKEGVGSSSKSSGVGGVNLQENIPEVVINEQPTSTDVARTYANMGPNILLTAMRRGTQGHAMHGKGSLRTRGNWNNLVSGVTQRLQNATNFFETNKKVFYLFTGRVNVGAGQSVALQIHPGQGNSSLPPAMNHPGYTTFVVATLQPDNVTLAGPPPITEFGVYPFVAKTYGYLPDVLASEPANAALDPLKLNLGVLQENCLFVPNQGGGGHFCMQVPISREVQTPGQLLSGAQNNDDTTRMNLLFYMRPDELADCFDQGLFHQLEYYSDKFKTTITARLAVHTQNFKLKNSNKDPTFMQYLTMLRKVLLESFTGIEAFTAQVDVRMGNPDTVYMYMVYKHFVTKIQDLTNELTVLNTEAANETNQSKLNANTAIRQRKYIQLRQLVQEMDVWNYAIQTSKHASTPYDRANHTNFSALGISRDPSDYNTPFGMRRLATYGLMGGTKPTSCYPRWMAHTWSAMKVVENMPSFDEAQLNAAVDLNVLLFNESRPTTQQMLIFSNTQSILASAQQNRAQLANASPQDKLQILLDTRTTPGNNKTVREELSETTAAQAALQADMMTVRNMSNEEFLAFTGMNKSVVRAQQALDNINARLSDRNFRAFDVGDMVEMPITEKAVALQNKFKAAEGQLTLTNLPTNVSGDLPNPKVRITEFTSQMRDNLPDIAYMCVNPDGSDPRSVFQVALLSSQSNVALANSNLIKRAIQTVEGASAQSGLDPASAARLLGRESGVFQASDPNIDVEEKLYAAKLDILHSRQLLDSEEAQARADATIYKMRVYQRAQMDAMERIAQMEANQQQLQALTAQQGIEYTSESQANQKYIFMKYELYKRKWQALNRSWNELYRIDAVAAGEDGKRPPLEGWEKTTGEDSSNSSLSAPVRVIKVAFALRAFDFVSGRLGLSITGGIMGALRNNIFITTQTLADTWNMGVLKSFSEWVAMDPEASEKGDFYTETWYAKWLETSRRLNQMVIEQAIAEREREQAQQRAERQAAQQLAQQAQQAQRDSEKKDEGDEFSERNEGRRKTSTTTTNTGSSNNDDDDAMDLDQGGGRRKNKTRKRKNKTKRRKKMKGGKKTKSKRKKKKSKTRRKRGGRDCKKILKEEKVCDKKSWMKASRKLHPDKGGDGDRFRDMNECYQANKGSLSCDTKTEIKTPKSEKKNNVAKLMDVAPPKLENILTPLPDDEEKVNEIFKNLTQQ